MSQDPNNKRWHEALIRGYERDDVPLRGLTWLVIGFVVFGALMHVGIWYVMQHFSHQSRRADAPQSAVIARSAALGGPELQPVQPRDVLPHEDLLSLRGREDAVLEHLGWRPQPVDGALAPPAALAAELAAKIESRRAASQPATAASGSRQGGSP